MMTESLRRVLREVEQLPAEEQETLAEAIERALEEQKWNLIVARLESTVFPERLAAEAHQENAAGLTRETTDRW